MSFYQTTSGVFIGLLVAVLLRADLLDTFNKGKTEPADSAEARHYLVIIVVSVAMIGGEITSLLVLLTAHATQAERTIVSLSALIAIIGTIPPAILAVTRRAIRSDALEKWMLNLAWAAPAVISVGAVATYLILQNEHSLPPGSLYKPRYYVVRGTCAAGSCGLNERAAPTPHSRKLGVLEEGVLAGVSCQTVGYQIHDGHKSSDIWDLLHRGAYVSDLYVSTPKTGSFSPGLERCPSKLNTQAKQG